MRSATMCLIAITTLAMAACSEEPQVPMAPENLTLAAPAAVFKDNFKVAFSAIGFVPCADGGNGEFVEFQVVWHILTHLTINGNHFTFKSLINDAGTNGVGLTTGDKYHEVGATNETVTGSFKNGQFSDTFTNSFLLVGQGPGNNFRLINNFHVTINANGEVTVVVENVTVECK